MMLFVEKYTQYFKDRKPVASSSCFSKYKQMYSNLLFVSLYAYFFSVSNLKWK